jgi:hypothetical protein
MHIVSLNEEHFRVILVLQKYYHKYETQSWTVISNKKNGNIYTRIFLFTNVCSKDSKMHIHVICSRTFHSTSLMWQSEASNTLSWFTVFNLTTFLCTHYTCRTHMISWLTAVNSNWLLFLSEGHLFLLFQRLVFIVLESEFAPVFLILLQDFSPNIFSNVSWEVKVKTGFC